MGSSVGNIGGDSVLDDVVIQAAGAAGGIAVVDKSTIQALAKKAHSGGGGDKTIG